MGLSLILHSGPTFYVISQTPPLLQYLMQVSFVLKPYVRQTKAEDKKKEKTQSVSLARSQAHKLTSPTDKTPPS